MNGLDHLHDVVIEATGKSLLAVDLVELLVTLPEGIKRQIDEWGLSDTLVREEIYDWLKQNEGEKQ